LRFAAEVAALRDQHSLKPTAEWGIVKAKAAALPQLDCDMRTDDMP
jgi:hypothetical protein